MKLALTEVEKTKGGRCSERKSKGLVWEYNIGSDFQTSSGDVVCTVGYMELRGDI